MASARGGAGSDDSGASPRRRRRAEGHNGAPFGLEGQIELVLAFDAGDIHNWPSLNIMGALGLASGPRAVGNLESAFAWDGFSFGPSFPTSKA